MAQALIVIAQQGFQPVEYSDTRKSLEEAGVEIKVASVSTNPAVGKDGSMVTPDLAIADVKSDDFDAIVVIGGPGALTLEEHITSLIKEFNSKGKVVAAICISPVMLAKADILEGKKATVWNKDNLQAGVLEGHGAEFIDEHVVVDGKTVTADGPEAAKEFGKKVAETI